MSQQTELQPLNPSRADVFDTWWRPWRLALKVVFSPIGVMAIVFGDMFFRGPVFGQVAETMAEPQTTTAFEQSAEGMTAMMSSVTDLTGVLFLLVFGVLVIQMLRAGPRV